MKQGGKVKPLWMFAHNCIVHPMMGLCELLTWDHYMPWWLEWAHGWTADKAGF
jgi:hypothetical protein